jgi:hypothetical protein
MWEQELVAFAYHYRRYFLYSAHRTPFAVHCGTLHGIDYKESPKDGCGRVVFARQASRFTDSDSDFWRASRHWASAPAPPPAPPRTPNPPVLLLNSTSPH